MPQQVRQHVRNGCSSSMITRVAFCLDPPRGPAFVSVLFSGPAPISRGRGILSFPAAKKYTKGDSDVHIPVNTDSSPHAVGDQRARADTSAANERSLRVHRRSELQGLLV